MHVVVPFMEPSSAEDKKKRERAPVLRHERLAEDTLLCLFDRIPRQTELHTLAFTQPAHQQYFTVGDKIKTDKISTSYQIMYTIKPADDNYSYKNISTTAYNRPGKDDPPPTNNYLFI